MQPIAFLQKESLLKQRAAERRRNIPKDATETGQCWQAAEEDGVKEIFVETTAQFVAAVESFDLQLHGKWGRRVRLPPQAPAPKSVEIHC